MVSMSDRPGAVIVDYGLGNLYSVRNACRYAGFDAEISSEPSAVSSAAVAILPGIGAFGDAMDSLRRLDLVAPLRDRVAAGRPLVGICLGLQLLMTESYEFGVHRGLDLIPGTVERLNVPVEERERLKVPHVGWNRIRPTRPWVGTSLEGTADGEHMYFVHSYRVIPDNPSVALGVTRYGDTEFCSALQVGTLTAWQFHPERSGRAGLKLYERIGLSVAAQEENAT
jgi:glutamine amidotransferase